MKKGTPGKAATNYCGLFALLQFFWNAVKTKDPLEGGTGCHAASETTTQVRGFGPCKGVPHLQGMLSSINTSEWYIVTRDFSEIVQVETGICRTKSCWNCSGLAVNLNLRFANTAGYISFLGGGSSEFCPWQYREFDCKIVKSYPGQWHSSMLSFLAKKGSFRKDKKGIPWYTTSYLPRMSDILVGGNKRQPFCATRSY